ncbi:MAG: hypothetical protein HZC25_07510 [Rhodospirillales bacterium]|nr:hypothetical protein [Rhodospirillales bacterium]
MTMTLESLIKANLAELPAMPDMMAPATLSQRRLFLTRLAAGGLAQLMEQAGRLHPGGLGILFQNALLTDQPERYRMMRNFHQRFWFEEKEAVAADIERAFSERDPPRLWAGFLLLIQFRDIVIRRVEYRYMPDRPPSNPPSAFVYCMQ